jgi:hypothetical protein
MTHPHPSLHSPKQHTWSRGQNWPSQSHPLDKAPTQVLLAGLQTSQAKQQVPPQQRSIWGAGEQQCSLAVHPLAPVGRRQVPRQHSCPAQQSVVALHAPPKSALHCPPQHCWPLGQEVGVQTHCRWLLQLVPGGQATHVAPPPPQNSLLVPG